MPDEKDVIVPPAVEQAAQKRGQELEAGLVRTRENLNADMLAAMIAPRAHFEEEFNLPGEKRAFFFTVDGVLNGRKVIGALFAAQCMLIFAANYLEACDLANRGLRSTIELMHEEYEKRLANEAAANSAIMRGLQRDAGGRRGQDGDQLARLPKMKALMAHVIGGLPWKW